jgi:hypothetical protein
MNIDWIKSVDNHNSIIISSENKFRLNSIVSTVDIFDDKTNPKLDYRTNFSVDNENVSEEAQKIIRIPLSESMNSLLLLDHEYFLIQYISKHIQQYKILNDNIPIYIKFLSWIRDASLILSNRLKLPKINKEYTGDLVKRTYEFCPHRSNCQINYGKKKGKCCAPHYIHNIIYYDVNMMIKYFEKNLEGKNPLFAFDQESFKILKQINTIQFVINQMFIELSTFKNSISNQHNDIEKYHHNCKVEEVKPVTNKYRFSVLADDDDEEEKTTPNIQPTQPRSNMNVYRVWKE